MTIPHSPKHPAKPLKPQMTRHALDVCHPLGRHLTHDNCRSITEMPGIDMLTYDMDSGHIAVTYDLHRVHLDDIEDKLRTFGFVRKRDLFHQIRHSLAHFFEGNEMRA